LKKVAINWPDLGGLRENQRPGIERRDARAVTKKVVISSASEKSYTPCIRAVQGETTGGEEFSPPLGGSKRQSFLINNNGLNSNNIQTIINDISRNL